MKWFRDRANRDRFRKEVQILEEEFDRTIVSFRRMSDVWTQLTSKVDAPGSAAYAHRKAIMYQGLEEDCVQAYAAVRKTTGCGISGLE